MSRAADDGFEDFVTRYRPELVRFVASRAVAACDVDDLVQTVFVKAYLFWSVIRQPRGFLYRVARNEIVALRRGQQRDRAVVHGCAAGRSAPAIGEDVYHRGDATVARDCLSVLSQREREVFAAAIDGCGPSETAQVLGISPATCRTHLHNARKKLGPLLAGEGTDETLQALLGWRLFQAWTADGRLPTAPRPLVVSGWKQSVAHKVDRERGGTVKPLDRGEVNRRRHELPIFGCCWLSQALADLGRAEELMAVVTDADAVVLWRGGHRGMLDRAGDKGFLVGACWDIACQGSNGISLALVTGRPVRMSRWEHFVVTHHDLCCYAAPVRHPRTGKLLGTLNLTGTQPIHHHLVRCLDSLTGRLHQQLATRWT